MAEKSTLKHIYPNLFSPVTVRGIRFKNRIISSPHGSPNMFFVDSSGKAVFSEEAAIYYGNIAKGGAAVVNTGHLGVDPRFYLGAHKEYFDLYDEKVNARILPPMHRVVDRIHAYGALASMELNHGGQWCTPVEGNRLVGPSYLEKENGLYVDPLGEEEMNQIADWFADAAYIGKRAGFDIINIHAGHNWLLGQFFSPIDNQRTDCYGGSVENRARFPKMVVDRIRERIGQNMLITMRISGSEIEKGGISIEDVSRIAEIMSESVDIIHLSAGKIHDSFTEAFTFPSQYMQEGVNTWTAQYVKQHTNVLVETVGGINNPEYAEHVIRDGVADFVAMARSFIADPDWAEKARLGKTEDIRPCIRCLHCMDFCEPLDSSGSRSCCSVNARRLHIEPLTPVIRSKTKKKVLVVGGGPAGMNAAMEIADQGHDVILLEKDKKLGGRLEFADFLSFKQGVKRYRDYLIHQVEKRSNIQIKTDCPVNRDMLKAYEADAIVIATGAQKFVPPIPGADLPNVIHSSDVFHETDKIGQHVVVIGGGDVGCELTIQLQTMGKQVTLIEAADRLMKFSKGFWEDKVFTEFFLTHEYRSDLRNFDDLKPVDTVSVHLSSKCEEIQEDGVIFTDENGDRQTVKADTVILSTGLRNKPDEFDCIDDLAETVLYIGDRKQPANIEYATKDGYYASLRI